jgi:hypothetical protein
MLRILSKYQGNVDEDEKNACSVHIVPLTGLQLARI